MVKHPNVEWVFKSCAAVRFATCFRLESAPPADAPVCHCTPTETFNELLVLYTMHGHAEPLRRVILRLMAVVVDEGVDLVASRPVWTRLSTSLYSFVTLSSPKHTLDDAMHVWSLEGVQLATALAPTLVRDCSCRVLLSLPL